VVQVVEDLPNKRQALSSNLSNAKKEKEKKPDQGWVKWCTLVTR
jgi:hypothetical protein